MGHSGGAYHSQWQVMALSTGRRLSEGRQLLFGADNGIDRLLGDLADALGEAIPDGEL